VHRRDGLHGFDDANAVAIPLRQAGATITPASQGALTVNITIP